MSDQNDQHVKNYVKHCKAKRKNAAQPILDGTKPIFEELRKINDGQRVTWIISILTLIVLTITLVVSYYK